MGEDGEEELRSGSREHSTPIRNRSGFYDHNILLQLFHFPSFQSSLTSSVVGDCNTSMPEQN